MIDWYIIVGAAGLGAAALGLLGYGVFSPRSRLLAPVIWRGQRGKSGQVALTFDDGPHPESTPAILDILAEHDVPAAFFVIGANAHDQAELLQRMHARGHLIANHSYDHDYMGTFGVYDYWVKQIERTNSVIESAIGRRAAFFRPPMGFKHHRMAKAARDCECSMVTWSRRAWDGLPTTPERILRHLNHRCQPGDIILMHDGAMPNAERDPSATIESLSALIENIRSSGLELVRLDELLGIQPYLTEPGNT